MSDLAMDDSLDYEEIVKDVELFQFRLLSRLVLVFRENHLAEMDEGTYLSHLKNRAQSSANLAILGLRKTHPFFSVCSHTDVLVLVTQIIDRARAISKERKKKASEMEEEFEQKKSAILEGRLESTV